jgi:hypothetical protein
MPDEQSGSATYRSIADWPAIADRQCQITSNATGALFVVDLEHPWTIIDVASLSETLAGPQRKHCSGAVCAERDGHGG